MSETPAQSNFTAETIGYDLDFLAGQPETKTILQDLCMSIEHRHLYKFWGRAPDPGVLLTGKSGNGKTHAARCLVGSVKGKFIELKYSDIASAWIDKPVENLKAFFAFVEEIAKTGEHVIVFIDEIDAMLPARGERQLHEQDRKRVNVFLQWMDGAFTNHPNVTIIGATNHVGDVDPAVRRAGRFAKIIELKDMDAEALMQVLAVQITIAEKIAGRNLAGSLVKTDIITALKTKKGLTGADMKNILGDVLAERAKSHIEAAIALNLDTKKDEAYNGDIVPPLLSSDDFVRAIKGYDRTHRVVGTKDADRRTIGFSMDTV